MKYSATEERLLAAMAGFEIVDCHEHLPPESERTSVPQDVFTLFSHYTRCDLFSAGMDADAAAGPDGWSEARPVYNRLFDQSVPLEQRWAVFRPYWEAIRHGSYARAARLTARLVYGIEDIVDGTYRELSERIASENTPGIYRRMLEERCRIRVALTQCARTAVGRPLAPVMPGFALAAVRRYQEVEKTAAALERTAPPTLAEYLDLVGATVDRWVAEGTVGIKLISKPNLPPDEKKAEEAFKSMRGGRALSPERDTFEVFENFVTHHLIELAAERDLAVAKNLPNVFLNLCWTHIISP